MPDDATALENHLITRGQVHFPQADPEILTKAAHQLIDDRRTAQKQQWCPLSGQAEYLDLARAVLHLATEPTEQKELLMKIKN